MVKAVKLARTCNVQKILGYVDFKENGPARRIMVGVCPLEYIAEPEMDPFLHDITVRPHIYSEAYVGFDHFFAITQIHPSSRKSVKTIPDEYIALFENKCEITEDTKKGLVASLPKDILTANLNEHKFDRVIAVGYRYEAVFQRILCEMPVLVNYRLR